MRERIRQFGGDLRVLRCEPGTLVEASLPFIASRERLPLSLELRQPC
jgi:signal transduction histidine kinase